MILSRSRVLGVALILALGGLAAAVRPATAATTTPDTVVNDYDVQYDHASFWFRASPDDPSTTFQCSLDAAKWATCTSPASYKSLEAGDHNFQVAAVDAAGNVDPTPVSMSWTASAPPPPVIPGPANDNFFGAETIAGIGGTVSGTTANATNEWNEPWSSIRGGASVWYLWTAPRSGSTTFMVAGSGWSPGVAIFEGDSPDRVALWSAGAGGATFNATQNVTYRIAVDTVGGGTGPFTLTWSMPSTGPANDYFADAETLSGSTGSVSGSTVGATAEPGEPIHSGMSCCDNSNEHSSWYRWTAPATGTAFFTTEGSAFDTVLRAYAGSSVSSLVPQGLYVNDTNPWTTWSRVELRATAGTTYYFAVDAADGSTGAVQLNWRMEVADPSDTVLPTVTQLTPANGATASGVVAFTADASDNVGVDRVVWSIMPNGSGFPWQVGEAYKAPYEVDLDTSLLKPGQYDVWAVAFDAAGNQSSAATYTLTVATGAAPPTLTVPKSMSREATGPGGVRIKFSATAQDYLGKALTVTCSPASGSLFRLGMTKVLCSAADSYGYKVSKTFTVTVVDSTPPVLDSVPSGIVVEATGPKGAVAYYTPPTASDVVDGAVPVTCKVASGSIFPLGPSFVSCTATDTAGNAAKAWFEVKVVDTTPPTLIVPADFVVDAVSPSGAAVAFTASATDRVSGELTPSCSSSDGDTLAIGNTLVECSATDAAGNTASAAFTVHVKGAAEQIDDTRKAVASLQLADSIASKLDSLLADAAKQLAVPRLQAVCGNLSDFRDTVSRQSGRAIAAASADDLVARASRIAAVAGC